MHAVYAFGLLIAIAFLGSRFLFRRSKTLSPFRYFLFSGYLYIFLGIFLGKSGLNIISSPVLKGFFPLIGFGLGWIGFLFGFQLERRYLRKFPSQFISLEFLQMGTVLVLVAAALFPVLKKMYPGEPAYLLLGMALAFGVLWTISSPSLITAASSSLPCKGNYYYLARFITSISGFWSILGLAFLASFWHVPALRSRVVVKGALMFCGFTLLAAGLGILFHHLTKTKADVQDLPVFLLGFVFFGSGAAFYFHFPPLYVGMVLGIVYSNLTKVHERVYPLLMSTEKTLYVVFLILIGALWNFHLDAKTGILIGFLLILRPVAYMLPLPLLQRILRFSFPLPSLYGLSFLSSGGIGVAFAVSISMAFPMELSDVFLSAALVAIMAGEFLSPLALKASLVKLEQSG